MSFDLSRSNIENKYFITFAFSYKAKICVVEYHIVPSATKSTEIVLGTIIFFLDNAV